MMRSARFTILGAAVLCLALLPPTTVADAPAAPGAKKKAAPPTAALDVQALADRIDAQVATRWNEARVVPTSRADDGEFLRRVSLDLIGRIPHTSEVHAFLSDKSPDKRRRLVEKLLDSSGYVNHFTSVWRDLMIPQANNQIAQQFSPQMESWLRKKLRDNVTYDQFVRQLLTADPIGNQGRLVQGQRQLPDPTERTVVAFYQANELKPENVAATTSRLFLGVKLECAQCHDHPFNRYSRDQFWQYTAFFAGIQPVARTGQRFTPARFDPAIREVKIPNTERSVKARFLDGKEPKFESETDPRATLADWMTSPDNPYFARAAVNHLWSHFFGVGIIDPIDEPSDDNPPSHPELLDEVSRQFALNKFDLKYLMKAITLSKTYQLSSRQTHPTQEDPRLFARMSVKGLSPEQLFDSVALAVGYEEPTSRFNRFNQGFARFQGMRGEFRNKFANHADRRTEFQTSILQALSMMNGRFTADATSASRSNTLAALINSPFMDTEGRLNALFLSTLSRKMQPEEHSRLVRYVQSGGPSRDPGKALSDVFWALLNSSEFILNH